MDELDIFRDFNRGVAAPSGDARRRAAASLTGAIEGRHGWRPGQGPLGRVRRRPRGVALAFVALAAVAVAALLVGSPWKSSPGFLERAKAALAPPAGSILHVRWNETHISRKLGCTVELPTQEVWIDQTPPHRFRFLAWSGPPDPPHGANPGTLACRHEAGIVEFGDAVAPGETPLMFVPPDTLTTATRYYKYPRDPVAKLRKAIASGSAHDGGTSEIDGRTVRRVRIDRGCASPPCDGPPFVYVDPETFAFVREEWPSGLVIALPGFKLFRFDVVVDYLAFEYLPRTAANVALTDIRAQHPDATSP